MKARISKRFVDSLMPTGKEFTVWDEALNGFGVRVRAAGAASYVVMYRAGNGRGAPVRRFTIGAIGKMTPDQARDNAKIVLAQVAQGHDPACQKATEREIPAFAELADRFMREHVDLKRKPRTAEFYRDIVNRILKPAIGTTRADKLSRNHVADLHASLAATPSQANRVLAVISSIYAFAGRTTVILENTNPSRGVVKFRENRRERFLTGPELKRLGAAIHQGETVGIPWDVDNASLAAKHLAKETNRNAKLNPFAAAAIRLLLFTGCRLREILNLRWQYVDVERGVLFLPDSKSGRKTVILNGPSLSVLHELPRIGPYVIAGDNPSRPRPDLKRPWAAIRKTAGLPDVRLHDLRHTYASFGASGGLGLPIIGTLLGHAQPATTARYAHLDNDPLKRASEVIASRISAALDGTSE